MYNAHPHLPVGGVVDYSAVETPRWGVSVMTHVFLIEFGLGYLCINLCLNHLSAYLCRVTFSAPLFSRLPAPFMRNLKILLNLHEFSLNLL